MKIDLFKGGININNNCLDKTMISPGNPENLSNFEINLNLELNIEISFSIKGALFK